LRATPVRPKSSKVTSTFQVDFSFERDLRLYGEREPVTPLRRRRPHDISGNSLRPQSAPVVRHCGERPAPSTDFVVTQDELAHIKKRLVAANYGCDVKTFFKRQDKDKSGTIEAEEFKSILRRILKITPEELPDEEIHQVIEFLDNDKSGGLDIDEIVKWLDDGKKETRQVKKKDRPMSAVARGNRATSPSAGRKKIKKKKVRPRTAICNRRS